MDGEETIPVDAATEHGGLSHAAFAFAFVSAFAFATVAADSSRRCGWRRVLLGKENHREQFWKANDIHRTLHKALNIIYYFVQPEESSEREMTIAEVMAELRVPECAANTH